MRTFLAIQNNINEAFVNEKTKGTSLVNRNNTREFLQLTL